MELGENTFALPLFPCEIFCSSETEPSASTPALPLPLRRKTSSTATTVAAATVSSSGSGVLDTEKELCAAIVDAVRWGIKQRVLEECQDLSIVKLSPVHSFAAGYRVIVYFQSEECAARCVQRLDAMQMSAERLLFRLSASKSLSSVDPDLLDALSREDGTHLLPLNSSPPPASYDKSGPISLLITGLPVRFFGLLGNIAIGEVLVNDTLFFSSRSALWKLSSVQGDPKAIIVVGSKCVALEAKTTRVLCTKGNSVPDTSTIDVEYFDAYFQYSKSSEYNATIRDLYMRYLKNNLAGGSVAINLRQYCGDLVTNAVKLWRESEARKTRFKFSSLNEGENVANPVTFPPLIKRFPIKPVTLSPSLGSTISKLPSTFSRKCEDETSLEEHNEEGTEESFNRIRHHQQMPSTSMDKLANDLPAKPNLNPRSMNSEQALSGVKSIGTTSTPPVIATTPSSSSSLTSSLPPTSQLQLHTNTIVQQSKQKEDGEEEAVANQTLGTRKREAERDGVRGSVLETVKRARLRLNTLKDDISIEENSMANMELDSPPPQDQWSNWSYSSFSYRSPSVYNQYQNHSISSGRSAPWRSPPNSARFSHGGPSSLATIHDLGTAPARTKLDGSLSEELHGESFTKHRKRRSKKRRKTKFRPSKSSTESKSHSEANFLFESASVHGKANDGSDVGSEAEKDLNNPGSSGEGVFDVSSRVVAPSICSSGASIRPRSNSQAESQSIDDADSHCSSRSDSSSRPSWAWSVNGRAHSVLGQEARQQKRADHDVWRARKDALETVAEALRLADRLEKDGGGLLELETAVREAEDAVHDVATKRAREQRRRKAAAKWAQVRLEMVSAVQTLVKASKTVTKDVFEVAPPDKLRGQAQLEKITAAMRELMLYSKAELRRWESLIQDDKAESHNFECAEAWRSAKNRANRQVERARERIPIWTRLWRVIEECESWGHRDQQPVLVEKYVRAAEDAVNKACQLGEGKDLEVFRSAVQHAEVCTLEASPWVKMRDVLENLEEAASRNFSRAALDVPNDLEIIESMQQARDAILAALTFMKQDPTINSNKPPPDPSQLRHMLNHAQNIYRTAMNAINLYRENHPDP